MIYLVEAWQTAFPSIEDICTNSVTRFLPIYHCWKVGYFTWTQYQRNQQTWWREPEPKSLYAFSSPWSWWNKKYYFSLYPKIIIATGTL